MQRSITILLLLVLSLSPVAVGDEVNEVNEVNRWTKVIAQGLIEAINNDSLADLKKLILPESLAQINEDNADYFDYVFNNDLKYTVPGEYTSSAPRIAPAELESLKSMFDYAVAPTHFMLIEFNQAPDSEVSLVRQMVWKDDRFYIVLPTPNKDTLASFREKMAKEKQAQKTASALYLKLEDPLRLQLTVMLDKGQRIEAYKRYSEDAGVDMAMARRVVDLLRGTAGLNLTDTIPKSLRQ